MKLPGTRLLAIARFFIDASAIARVLEPLVADWQREWLASTTTSGRVVIRGRGCFAFICSATYCFSSDAMPRDIRWRAWMTLSAFVALGTLVLAVPILGLPSALMAYWLPSMLALSVPFAMLPLAMLLGTSANRSGGLRHLTRFTIAVALVVFALNGWITPHANQAFREQAMRRAVEQAGEVAAYRAPSRGLRELTLPELFRVHFSTPGLASRQKMNEEVHSRVTLPLVPVLLAMMGWGLTRASNSAGAVRLFGWWVFACATFGFARSLGMTLERSWSTPREAAVWLPLVLWSAAIVVLMRTTRIAAGGPEGPPLRMQGTAEAVPSDRLRS
jgi:hypothetical protein